MKVSTMITTLTTALRARLNAVGAWAARFTFWRFVGLSLLLLIAANLINGLLFAPHNSITRAIRHQAELPRIDATAPAKPDAKPGTNGESVAGTDDSDANDDVNGTDGTDDTTATPQTDKRRCTENVRIGPSGVHVEKHCLSDTPAAGTDSATPAKPKPCVETVDVGWTGIHVKDSCRGNKDIAAADVPTGPAAIVDIIDDGYSIAPTVDLVEWVLALIVVLWILRMTSRARQKADQRADLAVATAEKAALERQVAEARLQTLQAQVEPHFLFNTLGAVEHLIETDPPRAATMQRHLIAFLRGAMPRMRSETVILGDEIELCRNYLAIMQIRMEERLSFAIDLPPELTTASFPPLMLQSVVENAIKHGLEPKAEGGSLIISARAAAGRLRVAVADSGLGFASGTAASAGTGLGLSNIRERLQRMFGDRAALVISPNVPTGTQVAIEIPYDDAMMTTPSFSSAPAAP